MCDGLEPRYVCACLYVAQQMLFIFKSPTEVTYVQLVHHCYCSPFMSSADLSQHVSVCPAVSCLCSRHSTGRCISCALLQVRSRFRPEFVNRIDEFTVFNPLARADVNHQSDVLCCRFAPTSGQSLSTELTSSRCSTLSPGQTSSAL